ncbi:MAG TPA: sigma-54-dependent Fis family transcriptional regulator [Methylophilaceae bacterium]|nr:sigma-54-dependent Fis family transcriptional regulator [Methylophilaceae bacterium]
MNRSTYLNRIRDARTHFLGNGEVPEGLLPESIQRSWKRCVKTGLAVDLKTEIERADQGAMSELRDRNASLLAQAQPEMENLYAHIMNTPSMVILSDSGGTILHAMGNPDFMGRAQRVALQPGVSWREEVTGTNAIGTALVEKNPVFVGGAEHYFERNTFLNCSAAPILDPAGHVVGVLDISGDQRQPQEHTMALVRMSAQMIENRLFNAQFTREITLHFHTRPEFIGTLWEGIAVFSQEGRLVAVNRSGAFQLGLKKDQLGVAFEQLFGLAFAQFLDGARREPQSNILLLQNGIRLHVTAFLGGAPHLVSTVSGSKPKVPADLLPLDRLDTGDTQMHKVVSKAKLALGHDIPILIEGETGTGKELLAQAIHQSGPRKQAPFVAINCASIPEGLIEAELFGHEEGAFTGARRRGAIGRVQQAHGGTLFLDEIGEMPLALQARLLRVIQEREIVPLGGNKPVQVDIVIISATNCRLLERVAKGEFREDLYYRLNGLRLTLPALRERTDLRQLISLILGEKLGRPQVNIHPAVVQLLQQHPWRGNIRQLCNLLRSALIFMEDNELRLEHLPEDFLEELQAQDMRTAPQQMDMVDIASTESALIRRALELHKGNMAAAARHLGISRATVYRKIKRLGLRP